MQRDLRDATPVDTGEARDGWVVTKRGEILNRVDHIVYLNQGHSPQAPAHFIEKTLSGYRGVVPRGSVVIYK